MVSDEPEVGWVQWRIAAALAALVVFNVLIFVFVAGTGPFAADMPVAQAQDGGGQEPEDKLTPIDFYPEPFADGVMAYSIRDPWDKTDLTFYFHNCPTRLDCAAARDAVRQSFQNWSAVSALTFSEVFDVSQADIEVTWTSRDPEGVLGEPGGVLAYNYFPRYGGDMFIDDSEPWTIGDGSEFDLIITATHEIGHGIGLGHSEFTDAIMYAYAGYATQIGPDDIEAVQALYGPPDASGPTAPTNNDSIDNPSGDIPAAEEAVDEITGNIDDVNPYDIWTLTVEDGMTVTLTMRRTSGDLDPPIGILTEDLANVLVENDNWVGTDAQIVYTFAQGGTYSVVATRYGMDNGSSSGGYTLTARFSQSAPGGGNDPGANAPPGPQEITWRITNFAQTDLCHVYFSPTSSRDWGPDQISDVDALQNGFYYDWELEPDTYDLQVWDCFGNKLEHYNISAERDVEIQVYPTYVTVIPLEPEATQPSTITSYAWRVSNYSNVDLCAIFFSYSSDNYWGENKIVDEILEANFYYEWQLEPGEYDIRVEDCSGGYLEFYNISLSSNIEIAIFTDEIVPRSLE
ncbi:MAG: matrixin family metalloprotease [Chloroflexi bacterium]|nr:matrixin family metalloprotease [Chloroflexota bacterium]